MSAPAIGKRHSRMMGVSLDAECEELMDALAETVGEGNRSKAVRYLILTHAGRIVETYREEHPPGVYQVEPWAKRRLSRELISEIAGRVRDGATQTDAFRLCGVTVSQASTWATRGRRDVSAGTSSVYADLVMTLERVKAEVRVERNKRIDRKDPKWLQEREYGDQYGKVTRTDATVTHTFNLVIDWERLSLAEARTLAALLRKGSPDVDSPALNRRNVPASSVIPAELIEGEAFELEDDDESPVTSAHESPAASESPAVSKEVGMLEPGPPVGDDRAASLQAAGDVAGRSGEDTRSHEETRADLE